eukprot:g5794.t1
MLRKLSRTDKVARKLVLGLGNVLFKAASTTTTMNGLSNTNKRLRRRPVDSSVAINSFIKSELKGAQTAFIEHTQYTYQKRPFDFFQLKKKTATGTVRNQIMQKKSNKYKTNFQPLEAQQEQLKQYYIFCPFTSINTTEDLEEWNNFIFKHQNNIVLTIDDYNNILKTMRTITGVENVLNEMNNLVYDVVYNEDTYYILMNFYFNCGFISKSKQLFKQFKQSLPVSKSSNEKVVPNRFKTLLYKYNMTKSKMKPDLLYVYQSRNDRDILRKTLFDFLENFEFDKAMKYFQIIRQYQHENSYNSDTDTNELTLLTHSDYILIMSLLNSSIDIKNFFNSLIETGELIPPKNIFALAKSNLNYGFYFDKPTNKYEKQCRNNNVLFTTFLYMYINQILVEEDFYDFDKNQLEHMTKMANLERSVLLENEFNTDFYSAENNVLLKSRAKELNVSTTHNNTVNFLVNKLQELHHVSSETINHVIQTYPAAINLDNPKNNNVNDSNCTDLHCNLEDSNSIDLYFDRRKRRSMHLKHLVTSSSDYSEAYVYFDRMREKGVACETWDYTTMFIHTLHTSKDMFKFIDVMDEDHKKDTHIKASKTIHHNHHPMCKSIYKTLADKLVLEQGSVKGKISMLNFLKKRHFCNDVDLQSLVLEVLEPVFSRSSIRNSKLRTSNLREMKTRGRWKELEWFVNEICTVNCVADIHQYMYLLRNFAITTTIQGEILQIMKTNNIALDDMCLKEIIYQLILEGHYNVAEHIILENNIPIEKLLQILRQLNGAVLTRNKDGFDLNASRNKTFKLLVELTTRKVRVVDESNKLQESVEIGKTDTYINNNSDNSADANEINSLASSNCTPHETCILSRALQRNKFIFPNSTEPFLLSREQQIELLNEIKLARKSFSMTDSKWSKLRDRQFRLLVKDGKKKHALKLMKVMGKNNVTNSRHEQSRKWAKRVLFALKDRKKSEKIQEKIKTNRFELSDAVSF